MFRNRAFAHDWDALLRAAHDGIVFPAVSLHVVRHGESELNSLDRFTGAAESPLTDAGKREAAAAAALLAGRYDIALWSGLRRSWDTLQIARRAAHISVDFIAEDCRLLEHSYGALEGTVRFPIDITVDGIPTPGAESYRQVAQRCLSLLLDIAELARARNRPLSILLSTHAGPCRILRGIRDNASEASSVLEWKPRNGEVLKFTAAAFRIPSFLLA
jgi:broad specificity phosphatase PhoE